MAYQMTKDLETGNTLIDTEHRQLFDAINGLLEACSKGQGRKEVERTGRFLMDYTATHFGDEERLQQRYKYPDCQQHKQYHETFKRVVAELVKELEEKGPSVQLVARLNTVLAGWLINHIKREDTKVAAHIRANS